MPATKTIPAKNRSTNEMVLSNMRTIGARMRQGYKFKVGVDHVLATHGDVRIEFFVDTTRPWEPTWKYKLNGGPAQEVGSCADQRKLLISAKANRS